MDDLIVDIHEATDDVTSKARKAQDELEALRSQQAEARRKAEEAEKEAEALERALARAEKEAIAAQKREKRLKKNKKGKKSKKKKKKHHDERDGAEDGGATGDGDGDGDGDADGAGSGDEATEQPPGVGSSEANAEEGDKAGGDDAEAADVPKPKITPQTFLDIQTEQLALAKVELRSLWRRCGGRWLTFVACVCVCPVVGGAYSGVRRPSRPRSCSPAGACWTPIVRDLACCCVYHAPLNVVRV
mgnify:CR=1 FL=1